MPAAIPPPPPAIHKPAPVVNQSKAAENYGQSQSVRSVAARRNHSSRDFNERLNNGHPFNFQPRQKHTNRLRSRKQAKLRANRKAKR
jgi:hypothetical protein